ncbi:MAG: DsrE family protein [Sediminibacterium sp.]|nr:DsrE family protein [Sediminibacterium sp.]
MKKLAHFVVIMLIFVSTQLKAQNNVLEKVHHVVMQLNTADTAAWSGVLGNIKNFQKIWPGKVEVEVVVHGKALNFLVASKSHLTEDIETLSKKGVQFSACENTMNKYGITKAMLLSSAKTVPSGVAELIIKQEAGWGYLKAGL